MSTSVEATSPSVVAAWATGPAVAAGPLTGYRLFDPPDADRVPTPGKHRLLQVHVPPTKSPGHVELLASVADVLGEFSVRRIAGTGVASCIVDSTGRRHWRPPARPFTTMPAGAAGTETSTSGLIIEVATRADAVALWALLDSHADQWYSEHVLDRSLHLLPGDDPPRTCAPVAEVHLTDQSGRRLVHLSPDLTQGPTVWVASRPGRFELHSWLRWTPGRV